MDRELLIFHLRPARRRARDAARAEALSLLGDLGAIAPAAGPLSEVGGLFWIVLPPGPRETASARFPRLGYTYAVDLAEPLPHERNAPEGRASAEHRLTRWRGRHYRLVRLYEEDTQAAREHAPDRRIFLLESGEARVRAIRGYRGDGRPLARRGLPVCDARLLVNLVAALPRGILLDPFAGIGGIVLEALASGWRVVTSDIDPALRYGLARLGKLHAVADVRHLPFAPASVDAIATEPPYHEHAEGIIGPALREMHRVLKAGGRLTLLCASRQAEELRREALALGLASYLDSPIDRKGVDVGVLAWQKRG